MGVRGFLGSCVLASFLALSVLPQEGSAVGIMGTDLGHDQVKVSLVKPGMPFQCVTNFQSKRKTSPLVGLYQGERLFGADAESIVARKPHLVVTEAHKLLGRNSTHPSVIDYLEGSFFGTKTTVNDRNGISFLLPTSEGDSAEVAEYSAEEMVAMLLAHAKEFAQVTAGGPLDDIVLTVPSYYTQAEKTAYLDAAKLAKLKVVGVVDENTAAGVQYGIDRVFENRTHHMLLYNMGYESTQATLFAYDAYYVPDSKSKTAPAKAIGQARVLAKAWDIKLGGRWFDMALINYTADKFNKEKGKHLPASANGDIRKVPSAMAKLRKNVVRTKEILSANEEYQMSVEGILPDVDFRMQLSRKILDEVATQAGLWERTTGPIRSVLSQAGLTFADIDVVELVGGGVRMPKVQKELHAFKANTLAALDEDARKAVREGMPDIATHLNGDESFALGAAFFAANRSSAFRVRKVGMIDTTPFAVGVRLTHLNPSTAATTTTTTADESTAEEGDKASAAGKPWSKRASLFRTYNNLDSTKRITFNAQKDLKATLFYEAPAANADPLASLPEGTSRTIQQYTVTGIESLYSDPKYRDLVTGAAAQVPKLSLSFELDANGFVSLARAEATLEEEYIPTPSPTPRPTSTSTPSASPSTDADAETTATKGGETKVEDDTETKDAEATATATAEPSVDAEDRKTAEETPEEAAAVPSSSATATPTPTPLKPVKRTLRIPLVIVEDDSEVLSSGRVLPMTEAHLTSAKAALKKLDDADEARRARESAKNSVEAYIYAAREKMSGEGAGNELTEEMIQTASTEEERDAVREALMGAEDWLYDDGAQTDVETYKGKLKELKSLIEPMFIRAEEARLRPKLINDTAAFVTTAKDMVARWKISHPQINATEIETATAAIDVFEAWFAKKVEEQEAAAPTDSPVLTRDATISRMKTLTDMLTRLNKRPKPTPTPSPTTASSSKEGSSSRKRRTGDKAKGGKAEEDTKEAEKEETKAQAAEEKDRKEEDVEAAPEVEVGEDAEPVIPESSETADTAKAAEL